MSTVLIVDNDNSFRKALRKLLEQDGFDACIEARSAAEAIERSKHVLPNLVITDYSLPGRNGLQLAQELKAIMPRLPIFMLTADRNLNVEREALSCGINTVFSKFEDLQSLLANAHAVIRNR